MSASHSTLVLIMVCLICTASVHCNNQRLETGISDSKEETLMIIELSRHGTRIPIETVFEPLPEWSTRLPVSLLTDIGFRQHYYLGKQMADRFPQIFNKDLTREHIYARSTRIQRTLGSAGAHLMGAISASMDEDQQKELLEFDFDDERQLPASVNKVRAGELFKDKSGPLLPNGFVPSQVFSHYIDQDYLLYYMNPGACPYGAKRHAEIIKEYKNDLSNNHPAFIDVMDQAAKIFGVELESFKEDLFYFAENIGDFIGLDWRNNPDPKMPKSSPLYKRVRRVIESINTVALLDKDIRAAATAPLFFNILDMLQKRAKNQRMSREMTGTQKYVYLSSHDTVLAPVLEMFGQIDPACYLRETKEGQGAGLCGEFPDTASNVVFELFNRGVHTYVRAYYNLKLIRVFGREEHLLDDFALDITKQLNPNWREFCKATILPENDDQTDTEKAAASFKWSDLWDTKRKYFWQGSSVVCLMILTAQIVLTLGLFMKYKKVSVKVSRRKGSESSLLSHPGFSPGLPKSRKESNSYPNLP